MIKNSSLHIITYTVSLFVIFLNFEEMRIYKIIPVIYNQHFDFI